jgi:hypothetical protein
MGTGQVATEKTLSMKRKQAESTWGLQMLRQLCSSGRDKKGTRDEAASRREVDDVIR